MAKVKQSKRIIALATAFVLCAVPMTVFAEDNDDNILNEEQQAEDEAEDGLLNLIIPIPDTSYDDPDTEEKENQNSAVYGDPAGTVVIEGDADKSDGEWDYTESTVIQQGKVEVTTTEITEKTENGEASELEYIKSETEATGTNDLGILSKKDSVDEEIGKADDTGYTYVGAGGTSHLWPAVVYDAPLTDDQKVELFGDRFENPEDARNLVEKSFVGPDGKTYYTHRVDNMGSSMDVEGWYEDGEWVKDLNGSDKYRVVYSIPQQFMLMDNVTGEVFTVYCADQTTTAIDGTYYYIENLEDASYYTDEQAAMIRTIAQHGYWGTLYEKDENGNIVYQKDADGNLVYQKDENGQDILVEKKDADGNVVYEVETDAEGNPLTNTDGTPKYKVDEDGNPVPVMEKVPVPAPAKGSLESMKAMLLDIKDEDGNPLFTEDEINNSLTDGVALTATQMAIWSYSNKMEGVDFINAFFAGKQDAVNMQFSNWASELLRNIPGGTAEDPLAGKEDEVKLMFKVYSYLINMDPAVYGDNAEAGEIPKTTENTIINSDNFLKDMSLTVLEKAKDHDNNKDEDDTNDAYRTNLSFALVVTPSTENGDDLVVRVVGADGGVIASGRLAGTNKDGEDFETIIPDDNGNYTFSDIIMIEGDQEFKITMEGIQNLKEGVYLYTSQVENEEGEIEESTSQTMVGMASGKYGVRVTKSLKFRFEVDDEKVVVKEYESDDDDYRKPPKEEEFFEEEFFEEDVPLGEFEEPVPEEIEIEEGDVILADIPKTGSSSLILLGVSMLSGAGLFLAKKIKKDEE